MFENLEDSNCRKAESANNIKKLKFEVYNEIFSCIEKIKSKYQNSAKEALISEICEKMVKSDFSSFFFASLLKLVPKTKYLCLRKNTRRVLSTLSFTITPRWNLCIK